MLNGSGDRERRELARLFDEQDRMLAEARAEIAQKELMQRADESGLVYRNHEPEPATDWSGWESWMGAHKAALKTEIEGAVVKALDQEHDAVDKALARTLEGLYHEIDQLENQNKELKGLLGDALGKLDKVREKTEASCRRQQDSIVELRQFEAERRAREQVSIERTQYINELRREVADVQVKLQNKEIDAALSERDARIERLEMQLKMLLQFMSVSGVDLPRGGF
jgi:hypothetical protein